MEYQLKLEFKPKLDYKLKLELKLSLNYKLRVLLTGVPGVAALRHSEVTSLANSVMLDPLPASNRQ